MSEQDGEHLVELDPVSGMWSRFFTIAPLVLIGTREEDGGDDLAPKHMVMPLGWRDYFAFVCTPRHGTYINAKRERAFTVTYAQPDQVLLSSLSATPRCGAGEKPIVARLPTARAVKLDAPVMRGGHLYLECTLDRVIDDFGDNSLVIGRIIAARAPESALLRADSDPADVLARAPLLVYVHPGRYAEIHDDHAFPFPQGFER